MVKMREGQIIFTYLHLGPDLEQGQRPDWLRAVPRLHMRRSRMRREDCPARPDERGGRKAFIEAAGYAFEAERGRPRAFCSAVNVPGVVLPGSW